MFAFFFQKSLPTTHTELMMMKPILRDDFITHTEHSRHTSNIQCARQPTFKRTLNNIESAIKQTQSQHKETPTEPKPQTESLNTDLKKILTLHTQSSLLGNKQKHLKHITTLHISHNHKGASHSNCSKHE